MILNNSKARFKFKTFFSKLIFFLQKVVYILITKHVLYNHVACFRYQFWKVCKHLCFYINKLTLVYKETYYKKQH